MELSNDPRWNPVYFGGGDKEPIEYSVIVDEAGAYEVDNDFIRSHPDWYSYMGHCWLNGDIVHAFILNG